MFSFLKYPIKVDKGYQHFKLWPDKLEIIVDEKSQVKKFELVEHYLKSKVLNKTVLDIGASNGLFSFLSLVNGAKHVVAIDNENKKVGGQDLDYVLKVANRANLKNITIINQDFSKFKSKTFDIVLCLAIMHHLYYQTELDSLAKLIKRLSSLTKKFLLIEWVDVEYGGPYVDKKPYKKAVFISELKKHFNKVEFIGDSLSYPGKRNSRELYACHK